MQMRRLGIFEKYFRLITVEQEEDNIDNVRNYCLMETPEKLLDLVKVVKTLPVSTAQCERGFSQMNILASSTRSSLAMQTLSTLMFNNVLAFHPNNLNRTNMLKLG